MPIRPPDNVQETRFTMGKKEAVIFDDLFTSIESYNKNKLLLSASKVGLGAFAIIGGVAGAYFIGRGLSGELQSMKDHLTGVVDNMQSASISDYVETAGDIGAKASPTIKFQKWVYENTWGKWL